MPARLPHLLLHLVNPHPPHSALLLVPVLPHQQAPVLPRPRVRLHHFLLVHLPVLHQVNLLLSLRRPLLLLVQVLLPQLALQLVQVRALLPQLLHPYLQVLVRLLVLQLPLANLQAHR